MMAESSLKEKTSKGLFWGGASSFIQQLLNAAFGIYLARTLSPGDYGLVGMLAVFSLTAGLLTDGGFGAALINRKEIRREDYDSVFWFNLLVSLLCAAVLFLCAPLIAGYFRHPELVKVARWFSFGFVLSGFGPAQKAYLSKKLMVKEMSIVNIVAVAVSGAFGVFLAWKGMAYWTLVFQALLLSFLTNLGYWLCSDWRPSLKISFRPVAGMMRFSVRLVFTNFMTILSQNFITVILGRYYPAAKVGFYTQANKWNAMGTTVLNGMVGSVSQPVLASVADDKERQLRVFRKMMRFAAFVSFPAMLGLALIAPEFITVALTDKWAESIPLLQILCVGGAFVPVSALFSWLIVSRGRSDYFMWSNVLMSAVMLLAVFLCYPAGVTPMVVAITAINVAWVLVWYIFTRREIRYTFKALLLDLLPFLGISAVSLAAAYFLSGWVDGMFLRMVVKMAVAVLLYFLLLRLSSSVTYRESMDFLLRRKTRA